MIPISRQTWTIALMITLIIVVIDIVCMKNQLSIAYPYGDEYALIAMSQDNPLQWITKGYSEAFNVFPEYFRPYSNFIRPTANLLYRIFSFVPYSHLSQLIAVNYLAHALLCAFLYIFSTSFGNSLQFSLTLSITAFFAPAFWNTTMVITPSFALDGVAALICLLSFLLLIRGRVFSGFLLLLMAILTKETALPIAAALLLSGTVFKQHRIIFGSCLILIIWLSLRLFAFDEIIGGTYSFTEVPLKQYLTRISVLALMPASYMNMEDIKSLIIGEGQYTTYIFLIGNCAIWLLTALLILRGRYIPILLNQLNNGSTALNSNILSSTTLVSLGASVTFLAVMGAQARFGYVSFIFWLMFVSTIKDQRILKYFVLLCLLPILIIGFLLRLPHIVNVDEIHMYNYKEARGYVEFLEKTEAAINTYVFNDFLSLYSEQNNVAKYAGVDPNFIRGSSIDINACSIENIKKIDNNIAVKASDVRVLRTTIPSCAEFKFYGADQELLIQNLHEHILRRNNSITYRFEGVEIGQSGRHITSFGRTLEATIVDSPILYFDFKANEWIYLP